MTLRPALGAATLAVCLSFFPGEALAHQTDCQPLGMDKAELLELREQKFEIRDIKKRETFALELLLCVGSADPDLRDKIAYEGFTSLLRGQKLSSETIGLIRRSLVNILNLEKSFGLGFMKPFAALILSEVVRADRVEPMFSDTERAKIVMAGSKYLQEIGDYRGFDENEGWRHGVAHGADLMMQLALNPATTDAQILTITNAVASQVSPASHSYIYGEPGRLVRPILFSAAKNVLNQADWAAWFNKVADPAPLDSWRDAYGSKAGLARLHNLRAFLQFVYVAAANSRDPNIRILIDPVLESLRKLP